MKPFRNWPVVARAWTVGVALLAVATGAPLLLFCTGSIVSFGPGIRRERIEDLEEETLQILGSRDIRINGSLTADNYSQEAAHGDIRGEVVFYTNDARYSVLRVEWQLVEENVRVKAIRAKNSDAPLYVADRSSTW